MAKAERRTRNQAVVSPDIRLGTSVSREMSTTMSGCDPVFTGVRRERFAWWREGRCSEAGPRLQEAPSGDGKVGIHDSQINPLTIMDGQG